MPALLVVVASTRPTRVGGVVADWFVETAAAEGSFSPVVADLAVLDLPLMDEREHPRLAKYEHRHTIEWSETVRAADAAVFVMPEYNSGYTAPLKNALDYLVGEWRYLPVGLLAYGGVSGGGRAVQGLRPVLTNLSMVPTGSPALVHRVADHLADGAFSPSAGVVAATSTMLLELRELAAALSPLRARALGRDE
jgi:NAD(P)H-dependent FMN reductase